MTPADIILDAYFGQKPPRDMLREAISTLSIKRKSSEFSQLQAAAGAVLLGAVDRAFGLQELTDSDGLSAGTRTVRHWGPFVPQRLFAVSWGESVWGPLLSDYFAVSVRSSTVVVVSAPMTEMFGYFDVALGRFPAKRNVLTGAAGVISRHWSRLQGFEMDPPQRILRSGLVPETTARSWADAVWSEDSDV